MGELETSLVEVVFPPQRALTDTPQIRIRGTVTDPASVSALDVAGVTATSDDGFGNWQALVPLESGDNTLAIDMKSREGDWYCGVAQVHVTLYPAMVTRPEQLAIDPLGQRIIAIDDRFIDSTLVSMDITTGFSTVLTGPDVGTGPSLRHPRDVAVNPSNSSIYLLDGGAVYAVDAATGDRTAASNADVGTGQVLSNAYQMIADPNQGRLFVSRHDQQIGMIVSVDTTTGDRSELSGQGRGAGPELGVIWSMGLDTDNDRIIVGNFRSELISVNLTTGDRALLAQLPDGPPGSNYHGALALAYDQARDRVLVLLPDNPAIMAVDGQTGALTVVSDATTGTGVALAQPTAMTLDAQRDRVVVTDYAQRLFVSVDLATGDRAVFAYGSRGDGPLPIYPYSVLIDRDEPRVIAWNARAGSLWSASSADGAQAGDRAVLVDTAGSPALDMLWGLGQWNQQVVGVNLPADLNHASPGAPYVVGLDIQTGATTVISSAVTGAGPPMTHRGGMALDGANNRALVSWFDAEDEEDPTPRGGLSWVDLTTGDRTVVASHANDGLLRRPLAVVLTPTGDRAFVLDSFPLELDTRVLSVDLMTGLSTVLSSNSVGVGAELGESSITGMSYDPWQDRLLVVAGDESTLIGVDVTTGDRTVISGQDGSGQDVGGGARMMHVFDVDIADGGHYAVTGDVVRQALMAIDLVTGERVIISR